MRRTGLPGIFVDRDMQTYIETYKHTYVIRLSQHTSPPARQPHPTSSIVIGRIAPNHQHPLSPNILPETQYLGSTPQVEASKEAKDGDVHRINSILSFPHLYEKAKPGQARSAFRRCWLAACHEPKEPKGKVKFETFIESLEISMQAALLSSPRRFDFLITSISLHSSHRVNIFSRLDSFCMFSSVS